MQCGVYQHYKGGLYQVLGIGQHTETDEILVIYVALSGPLMPGPRIRCRPITEFNGPVEVSPKIWAQRFVYKHDGTG